MNKIDYLEKELLRLLAWIQVADTRIVFVLPLSTAMLGMLAALAPKITNWSTLSILMVVFSVIFLVISIACLAFATFPRTDGPKGSMIFFIGISNKSREQFRDDVDSFTEEKYIQDLSDQCHINATIADAKFSWVKRSLIFLFLSSTPWFISVYLLYGVK